MWCLIVGGGAGVVIACNRFPALGLPPKQAPFLAYVVNRLNFHLSLGVVLTSLLGGVEHVWFCASRLRFKGVMDARALHLANQACNANEPVFKKIAFSSSLTAHRMGFQAEISN
jgi:hypothetical protein